MSPRWLTYATIAVVALHGGMAHAQTPVTIDGPPAPVAPVMRQGIDRAAREMRALDLPRGPRGGRVQEEHALRRSDQEAYGFHGLGPSLNCRS